MGYLAVAAVLLVVVAAVLLFTPVGKGPLDRLFAVGDPAPFDFAASELADEPNQFLMCPPGLCRATPHAESPLFEVPVGALSQHWREVAAAQPRVTLLAEDQESRQFDYVQRTARFRFPDVITVRFIALSPETSTLAVYSRSLYGKSDFGVNQARIEAWLALLRARL